MEQDWEKVMAGMKISTLRRTFAGLARTEGYQSRRGAFAGPIDDAQQFLVAHLFNARDPIIQFGRLIGSHVDIDHLPDFRRFAWCDVARRYRLRDGGGNVSGIAGAIDRRQREPHGAVFARGINPVETYPESDHVAPQRHLDGLLGQGLCLSFEQSFACQGGRVPRTLRTTCGIAGSTRPKPARLLFACIFKRHRAAPLPIY
jgi:hypothetical protein